MSELTKQQLINELVTHGVQLPASTAKKSEYVKIYEKYVAPVAQSKGDFSSDDEDLPVNDVKAQVTMDTSTMVINGLDVTSLDDDDLYARLQDLGSPVGPIVDSTRAVYQKKLFVLMGGQVLDSSPTFNGDVEQEDEDEYSDSEPEAVVDAPVQTSNRVVTESSRTTTYTSTSSGASAVNPPASHLSETRRRLLHSGGDDSESSGMVYDPDLHTPSPRRSLRTVTSSSSETTTYRRMVNNGKTSSARFATDGKDEVDSSPASGKLSSALRLLVKLIFLALIIAAALYFYQNNPTESPFKAIEEMARQALEAASGEEVTTSSEGADEPAAPPPPQQPEVTN